MAEKILNFTASQIDHYLGIVKSIEEDRLESFPVGHYVSWRAQDLTGINNYQTVSGLSNIDLNTFKNDLGGYAKTSEVNNALLTYAKKDDLNATIALMLEIIDSLTERIRGLEVPVSNITITSNLDIEGNTITIHEMPENFKLTAEITPDNATYPSVEWTSSDESVATIDNFGNVTIVGQGQCQLMATSQDLVENQKFAYVNLKVESILVMSTGLTGTTISMADTPQVTISVYESLHPETELSVILSGDPASNVLINNNTVAWINTGDVTITATEIVATGVTPRTKSITLTITD